jgi:hypothetical protein
VDLGRQVVFPLLYKGQACVASEAVDQERSLPVSKLREADHDM